MRKQWLAAAATLVALTLSTPVPAQAPITGITGLSNDAVRDVVTGIMKYAKENFACSHLESMTASVLPVEYKPPPRLLVEARGVIRYERWTAMFCRETASFLVATWDEPDGRTGLAVGYPFEKPDDAS